MGTPVIGFLAVEVVAGVVWTWGGPAAGAALERTGTPPNGGLEKTEAEWRQLLTPDQYWVAR